MKGLRNKEAACKEKGGKGVVPDAVGGEINGEGIQGPAEGGERSDATVEGAAGKVKEGNAGEGGKKTVQAEDGKGDFDGVKAEEFEAAGEEIGVERWNEGGGAGDGEVGGAEALTEEESAGGPAHCPAFPAEVVVVDGMGADLAEQAGDDGEAKKEGEDDDARKEEGAVGEESPVAGEGFDARGARRLP